VAVVDELAPLMRRNILWYLMAFEASYSINPMRRDAAAQQLRGQAVSSPLRITPRSVNSAISVALSPIPRTTSLIPAVVKPHTVSSRHLNR